MYIYRTLHSSGTSYACNNVLSNQSNIGGIMKKGIIIGIIGIFFLVFIGINNLMQGGFPDEYGPGFFIGIPLIIISVFLVRKSIIRNANQKIDPEKLANLPKCPECGKPIDRKYVNKYWGSRYFHAVSAPDCQWKDDKLRSPYFP